MDDGVAIRMDGAQPSNRLVFWSLALTTALFFMWGFSYGLLDVLNKHFQDVLRIDKAKSTLMQFAYFGAYATVFWPSGRLMERIGYQKTILFGLVLYAVGAFLFIPSAASMNFTYFVISLFVLASGLVCIETAASPYVTVLGPPEGADRRIAIAQCVFGAGAFFGPIVGGTMFFGIEPSAAEGLRSVELTYAAIGVFVLVFAGIYGMRSLPKMEVAASETGQGAEPPAAGLLSIPSFRWAVLAQWLNVGGQVGIGALFINFAVENWPGLGAPDAAYLLSIGMALFLVGRFVSTALLGRFATNVVLTMFAGWNVALLLVGAMDIPQVSTLALLGSFFGCGGTYSFIFALGIRGLGANRKRGAAALVFGVSGGAIVPPVMGFVADGAGTPASYLVAAGCYLFVLLFGLKLYAAGTKAPS